MQGGIIQGPSVVGQNKHFMAWILSPWSTPILESVVSIILLFLIGLEFNIVLMRWCWKRASDNIVTRITISFPLGQGLTFLSKKALKLSMPSIFGSTFMVIGVSLSITAFLVLARINGRAQAPHHRHRWDHHGRRRHQRHRCLGVVGPGSGGHQRRRQLGYDPDLDRNW